MFTNAMFTNAMFTNVNKSYVHKKVYKYTNKQKHKNKKLKDYKTQVLFFSSNVFSSLTQIKEKKKKK